MGPIKAGIQGATAYAIARKGLQTYEKHEADKQILATQQLQQFQQAQQAPQAQQSQDQFRAPPTYEHSNLAHRAWCNGQCNGQCSSTITHGKVERPSNRDATST